MERGARSCKHVVLVHGGCHGAWCWYKVSPVLRAAGYRVSMPDMAASGVDERRIHQVPTFADYSQPLLEILRALPPGERVVLVGHSLGGLNIALAMDTFPQKVAAAVFISAFMPDTTTPPSYVLDKYNEGASFLDTQFKSYSAEEKLPTSLLFGPQFMHQKLYQLCSPEDVTLGSALIRMGSLFVEDLWCRPPLSKDRYGSMDAVYIVCGQDLAITVEFQRWMIENNPVKEVKMIESADHMAMLSSPGELCQCLMEIIDAYA